MFSQTHSQFIESINRLTKKVIENSDSFHNYYIDQDNSFYSDTLPYLIKPNTDRNSYNKTENRLIQLKKNNKALNILRHEHFRSKKIPKLCPIFNNKGDLIPSIAINSKISKRDFNNTISTSSTTRSLGSFPLNKKNLLSYNEIKNNNTQFDYFNNYKNDFFNSSEYINLKYNEEEIFNQKEKYDNILKEKVEYFKKNKNENLTTFLEKSFIFGPKKKKIHLKLTSLMIYFEDPSEVKEPYNNNSINKNLQIEFPFSLLPLFYYGGIESFKKLLSNIIKFDNNYEKVRIDDDLIYKTIFNLKEYSSEAKEIEKKKQESFKEPKKHKNSITLEHNLENDIENIQNEIGVQYHNLLDKRKKIKSFSIHPLNKNIKNQKYNSYSFLWITPKKNFKVTIILPLISYTVPSNSIKVQQFINFELLFYLYNLNFVFWDFYIMKYLFGFKQFRFLLERLTSHLPIFNIKLFLNEPKKSEYTLNEEQYKFIYTNEKEKTQIITLTNFSIRVTILDYQNHQSNEYHIYFNFKQLIKIIQIGKFASKIYFLIKFMDINNDNTLIFNYHELEQFEVFSWLNDIEKYNGSYFLQKIKNPIEKLIREFNASPTKKVKLELNKPIIKIYNFNKISEKYNKYSLFQTIIDEFPNKKTFLEWCILIKDSLNEIEQHNLITPVDKEANKKMSIIQATIDLDERNSISNKKKDKQLMKSHEDEKFFIKRAFSTLETDNEKIFDMIKGKRGTKVDNIELPLPVIKKIKTIAGQN